jgi:hypothetical protein
VTLEPTSADLAADDGVVTDLGRGSQEMTLTHRTHQFDHAKSLTLPPQYKLLMVLDAVPLPPVPPFTPDVAGLAGWDQVVGRVVQSVVVDMGRYQCARRPSMLAHHPLHGFSAPVAGMTTGPDLGVKNQSCFGHVAGGSCQGVVGLVDDPSYRRVLLTSSVVRTGFRAVPLSDVRRRPSDRHPARRTVHCDWHVGHASSANIEQGDLRG